MMSFFVSVCLDVISCDLVCEGPLSIFIKVNFCDVLSYTNV